MAKRLANKDNPRLVSLIIERIERIKLPIDNTIQHKTETQAMGSLQLVHYSKTKPYKAVYKSKLILKIHFCSFLTTASLLNDPLF